MANICSTQYKVFGPKEQLERLKELLESQLREGEDAGYRNWQGCRVPDCWCGWVVVALGGNPDDIYCRGDWECAEWEEGSDPCLTFFVNSAWDELSEWREFLEEHFQDLVFCYQAEELGCGVFTTNSPDVFEDKYVLISTQHGTDYFSSVEVLCEAVKDAVKGSNPKSLRQCREAVDSVEDVYLFECANVGF